MQICFAVGLVCRMSTLSPSLAPAPTSPLDGTPISSRFAVFQGDRRMSVAQIMFSLKRGENNRAYGHVKSVRVDRDFRGRGLGPLLFKEVWYGMIITKYDTRYR